MKINYWWYWIIRVPWKIKYKWLGCFMGIHNGVYGIHGYNKYHVDCLMCGKRLDEGIEFEDNRNG